MRRGWARSEASWDVPGPQREASVNSILYPKAPPLRKDAEDGTGTEKPRAGHGAELWPLH